MHYPSDDGKILQLYMQLAQLQRAHTAARVRGASDDVIRDFYEKLEQVQRTIYKLESSI